MRRNRLPSWWYRLRYTAEGHLVLGILAVAALLTVAILAGLPKILHDHEQAYIADCVKRGGHIEYEWKPKGSITPICHLT